MSSLKYLNEGGEVVSGDDAQNFLQNKLNKSIAGKYTAQEMENLKQSGGPAVVNASDGAIPEGGAYPKQYKEGTGSSTTNPYDYSADTWAHASGEVGFKDDWSEDYAQQIKGKGALNESYVQQFEGLSKGDSAVDDDGEWRTLKSAKNSEATTKEDFQKLAKEWKAAGFDVRVQDLDNSQGAEWADIAVRKGPGGTTEGGEEVIKPIEHSPEQKQAVERVRAYENDINSGKTSNEIFGGVENVAGSQYAFDAQSGAGGITAGVKTDSAADDADRAAASFLENKKDGAKKYMFEANYGQQ